MTDSMEPGKQDSGAPAPPPPPRSMPMAAIAGALILVGLVGFALYRRGATTPTGEPAAPAAPAATTEGGESESKGTPIVAQAPVHLSPEASILAERYRCVCGCNDTLSVCTCRNPKGSEEMKKALQDLVSKGGTPDSIDAAMAEQFGEAALLKNPAPPQTLPSHATGAPPPAPPKKK